jgi:ElaB/YqjD/DUF883 family membrane-anchored ribosome-binding protein
MIRYGLIKENLMSDPIPSAVQEVVDLFVSEFASLKFGDLEPSTLAAATEEVKTIAADVTRAETELEKTRALLAEKRDALLQKAQRALSYARVYAENRPELASRLDSIALPRSSRRNAKPEPSAMPDAELSSALEATAPTARRRGRPRSDARAMSIDDIGRSEAAATGDGN